MRAAQIVEALLFASDAPLTAADLARGDEGLDEEQVESAIEQLRAEYEAGERSFQIYEIAGGYQILTRPEYAPYLERFDTVPQNARLSGPALEVLAVIAYRQPIGRAEIEEIRGVGSAGVLRTLLDRGVVEVVARGEGLGRPLLYGTTRTFLEHFGFRSLEDLPRPEELPVVLRSRAASDENEARATSDEAPATADEEAPRKGKGNGREDVGRNEDVSARDVIGSGATGDDQDFRATDDGGGDVDGSGLLAGPGSRAVGDGGRTEDALARGVIGSGATGDDHEFRAAGDGGGDVDGGGSELSDGPGLRARGDEDGSVDGYGSGNGAAEA